MLISFLGSDITHERDGQQTVCGRALTKKVVGVLHGELTCRACFKKSRSMSTNTPNTFGC